MTGNEFILSFDIDWASDEIIRAIADRLTKAGVKATWFVTHDSPAVQELKTNNLFECGLHPNYLPGSTQGNDQRTVINHLLQIIPNAVSVRSHAVVQSGPLLHFYTTETNLKIESSTFLPEMPNIIPLKHQLPAGTLLRVPFFWADDFEICKANPTWDLQRYAAMPGLKVLMFHPIHIWLDSASFSDYENWKKMGQRKSNNESNGTAHFFDQVVDFLAASETSYTMSDILKFNPNHV
jgi:hypothetical protein